MINDKLNFISKIYIKYQNKDILAFSLIELSIVLIIIGLLIAGVTGGSSLIESAKITRISTEFKNYEQALYSFYSLYDRLPGDINNDGLIGYQSKEQYTANSFPAPYNSNSDKYGIPTEISGPFVELYLLKVIDFEPKNTSNTNFTANDKLENYFATPFSNAYNNAVYNYRAIDNYEQNYFINGRGVGIALRAVNINANKDFTDMVERIDNKFDDGTFNTGKYRAYCYDLNDSNGGYVDYKDANQCSELSYITDL